jgi:hypothetical protein
MLCQSLDAWYEVGRLVVLVSIDNNRDLISYSISEAESYTIYDLKSMIV